MPAPYFSWAALNALLLVAGLLLTSCGFHLRGNLSMPHWFNQVAVIAPNHAQELTRQLNQQLEVQQIKIHTDPVRAPYWLVVDEATFQRQISGVSSSTTPRQYQLLYTVRFKLVSSHGKTIVAPTPILITRHVTINNERILGSDEEETLTRLAMVRDAVMQMLNRISRAQVP